MDKETLLKIKQRFDFETTMMQEMWLQFNREQNTKLESLFHNIMSLATHVIKEGSVFNAICKSTVDIFLSTNRDSTLTFQKRLNISRLNAINWEMAVGLCTEDEIKDQKEKCEIEIEKIDAELEALADTKHD